MADLDERFRSLARTSAPDLWEAIRDRRPAPLPRPPIVPRLAAAFVALAVASAGIGFAVVGLRLDVRERSVAEAEGLIAFSGFDGETWQIYSVAPDGSGLRQLTHLSDVEAVAEPAWSPDGQRIAFVVQGLREDGRTGRSDIWVMGADGSSPRPITDGPGSSFSPSWSPNGTRIAYVRDAQGERPQIWIVGSDGSNQHAFTRCAVPECVEDSSPAWSPDGERIAFVRFSGAGAIVPVSIMVWPVEGSEGVEVIGIDDAEWAMEIDWSPDGTDLAFTRSFEDANRWGISVVGADGTGLRSFAHLPSAQSPSWSPDGSRIVFQRMDPETGRIGLLVMNEDGTGVRAIPGLQIEATSPAWHPVVPTEEPWPEPVPTEPPVPATVEVEVSTTEGVAEFPSAVTVGEGGVWVTAPNQDDSGGGEVIRLDPFTGGIVARIPTRAAPGWEFGGAGLTVGDGGVWTLGVVRAEDGGCCDGLVTRVDPATNAVADELRVPGIASGDLWVDGDTVFVLGFEARGPGLELVRVDAATHEISWRVPVPGQWSQTVFVAGGSVWVAGTAPDARGPIEVTTLYRYDPATGTLLGHVEHPASQFTLVVHGDAVWLRTGDGAQRFDALSGRVVGEPVRPGPGCCTGPFVSDGAGGVWVVSSPGGATERSIWQIDATGEVVAMGTVEDRDTFEQMLGQSYAFDPETKTIWVQHYKDSVSRVRLLMTGS